jgi:PAS domain S-box-containing protein
VALVSLVDEHRQFFKSCVGLPEPWAARRQTPLSHSFCQHVVATGGPLAIEDARRDPLVCDNPAIVDLDVVAYLGVPLRTPDGQVIGSFCVIDGRPRAWSEEDMEVLQAVAESVMTEIELRLDVAERRRAEQAARVSEARYRTMIDQAPVGILVFAPDGALTQVNRAWEELWGIPEDQVPSYNILGDPQLEADGMMPLIRRAFEGEAVAGQPALYDPARSGLPGRARWVEANLYAVRTTTVDPRGGRDAPGRDRAEARGGGPGAAGGRRAGPCHHRDGARRVRRLRRRRGGSCTGAAAPRRSSAGTRDEVTGCRSTSC